MPVNRQRVRDQKYDVYAPYPIHGNKSTNVKPSWSRPLSARITTGPPCNSKDNGPTQHVCRSQRYAQEPLNEDVKADGRTSSPGDNGSCRTASWSSVETTSSASTYESQDDDRRGSGLSPRVCKTDVIADRYKRQPHSSLAAETQFDCNITHIRRLLEHMSDKYDTVTAYSMGLIEPGDIVYYLRPFTLGLHQTSPTAVFGGSSRSTARMAIKGRFGIVISKFGEHLKVVDCYTFGRRGLARAKARHLWGEYVGIREAYSNGYRHPSPNEPLEIGYTCCEFSSLSSVHLVTEKISLSNGIMIAGNITSDSLSRLRAMVRKLED